MESPPNVLTESSSRSRWNRWLNLQFDELQGGVSREDVAKKATRLFRSHRIYDHKKSENQVKGGRILDWLRDKNSRVVPYTAYRIGEAIRHCEAKTDQYGPRSCGPIALHAAGHYRETIALLRELAIDRRGAREAVILFCLVPESNLWLETGFEDTPQSAAASGFRTVILGDLEQLYMKWAKTESPRRHYFEHPEAYPELTARRFGLYNRAWRRVMAGGSDPTFSAHDLPLQQAWWFATAVLQFMSELQKHWGPEEAALEAWWMMRRWALRADAMTYLRTQDRLEGYFSRLDAAEIGLDRMEDFDQQLFTDALLWSDEK